MLKVVAVENPFLMDFRVQTPVNACLVKANKAYIYNTFNELVPLGSYLSSIDTIKHAVEEGRYEWVDFTLSEGDAITRDYDGNILINSKTVNPFSPIDEGVRKKVSDKSLKLFNLFLQDTNRDNKDLVDSLKMSLGNGYFRKEVEQIISEDVLDRLTTLDREIVVRVKFEGSGFVENYVGTLMKSGRHDRFIDINYFFRRVFNLEVYNYISF